MRSNANHARSSGDDLKTSELPSQETPRKSRAPPVLLLASSITGDPSLESMLIKAEYANLFGAFSACVTRIASPSAADWKERVDSTAFPVAMNFPTPVQSPVKYDFMETGSEGLGAAAARFEGAAIGDVLVPRSAASAEKKVKQPSTTSGTFHVPSGQL